MRDTLTEMGMRRDIRFRRGMKTRLAFGAVGEAPLLRYDERILLFFSRRAAEGQSPDLRLPRPKTTAPPKKKTTAPPLTARMRGIGRSPYWQPDWGKLEKLLQIAHPSLIKALEPLPEKRKKRKITPKRPKPIFPPLLQEPSQEERKAEWEKEEEQTNRRWAERYYLKACEAIGKAVDLERDLGGLDEEYLQTEEGQWVATSLRIQIEELTESFFENNRRSQVYLAKIHDPR